jgi:hypothetical protein
MPGKGSEERSTMIKKKCFLNSLMASDLQTPKYAIMQCTNPMYDFLEAHLIFPILAFLLSIFDFNCHHLCLDLEALVWQLPVLIVDH